MPLTASNDASKLERRIAGPLAFGHSACHWSDTNSEQAQLQSDSSFTLENDIFSILMYLSMEAIGNIIFNFVLFPIYSNKQGKESRKNISVQ